MGIEVLQLSRKKTEHCCLWKYRNYGVSWDFYSRSLSKTLCMHLGYYSLVAFHNLLLSFLSRPLQCFNVLIL